MQNFHFQIAPGAFLLWGDSVISHLALSTVDGGISVLLLTNDFSARTLCLAVLFHAFYETFSLT